VAGGWRRLHNEELHNFYTSPDIIRRMRWAGHVTRMGGMRNARKVLVGKPEGINYSEDPGVDGTIILKWILEK
jgi:hypothetical protein